MCVCHGVCLCVLACMCAGGVTASDVLYFFPTATSLSISSVDVVGSVLAPNAALTFINGHASGSFFVASVVATGQIDPVVRS